MDEDVDDIGDPRQAWRRRTADIFHYLTSENIAAIKLQFERIDEEHHRGLTLQEFVYVMIKCLGAYVSSKLEFVVQLIDLFQQVDVNDDREMEWSEFTGYIVEVGLSQNTVVDDDTVQRYEYQTFDNPDGVEPLPVSAAFKVMDPYEKDYVAVLDDSTQIVRLLEPQPQALWLDMSVARQLRHDTGYQPHQVLSACHVPDQHMIVVCSCESTSGPFWISFWSTENQKLEKRLMSRTAQDVMTYVRSRGLVYTTSSGNGPGTSSPIFGWCPRTFKRRQTLVVPEGAVTCMESLTGNVISYLATGARDGGLCLWDIRRGEYINKRSLIAHEYGVAHMQYSVGLRTLLTAGFEPNGIRQGSLRDVYALNVWDVAAWTAGLDESEPGAALGTSRAGTEGLGQSVASRFELTLENTVGLNKSQRLERLAASVLRTELNISSEPPTSPKIKSAATSKRRSTPKAQHSTRRKDALFLGLKPVSLKGHRAPIVAIAVQDETGFAQPHYVSCDRKGFVRVWCATQLICTQVISAMAAVPPAASFTRRLASVIESDRKALHEADVREAALMETYTVRQVARIRAREAQRSSSSRNHTVDVLLGDVNFDTSLAGRTEHGEATEPGRDFGDTVSITSSIGSTANAILTAARNPSKSKVTTRRISVSDFAMLHEYQIQKVRQLEDLAAEKARMQAASQAADAVIAYIRKGRKLEFDPTTLVMQTPRATPLSTALDVSRATDILGAAMAEEQIEMDKAREKEAWKLRRLNTIVCLPRALAHCGGCGLMLAGDSIRMMRYMQVMPTMQALLCAMYVRTSCTFLTATAEAIIIWDALTGRPLRVYHCSSITDGNDITSVCLDSRKRKLIVGDSQGSLRVLNYQNGAVMKELDPHGRLVCHVSYSDVDQCVISAGWDGDIHITDEAAPDGYQDQPRVSVLLRRIRLPDLVDGNLLDERSSKSMTTSGLKRGGMGLAATSTKPKPDATLAGSGSHPGHSAVPTDGPTTAQDYMADIDYESEQPLDITAITYSSRLRCIAVVARATKSGTGYRLMFWDYDRGTLLGIAATPETGDILSEIDCITFLDPYAALLSANHHGEFHIWAAPPSEGLGSLRGMFRHPEGYSSLCLSAYPAHSVPAPGSTVSLQMQAAQQSRRAQVAQPRDELRRDSVDGADNDGELGLGRIHFRHIKGLPKVPAQRPVQVPTSDTCQHDTYADGVVLFSGDDQGQIHRWFIAGEALIAAGMPRVPDPDLPVRINRRFPRYRLDTSVIVPCLRWALHMTEKWMKKPFLVESHADTPGTASSATSSSLHSPCPTPSHSIAGDSVVDRLHKSSDEHTPFSGCTPHSLHRGVHWDCAWKAHNAGIVTLEWVQDGDALLSASIDGLARLWDADGHMLGTLDTTPRFRPKAPAWDLAHHEMRMQPKRKRVTASLLQLASRAKATTALQAKAAAALEAQAPSGTSSAKAEIVTPPPPEASKAAAAQPAAPDTDEEDPGIVALQYDRWEKAHMAAKRTFSTGHTVATVAGAEAASRATHARRVLELLETMLDPRRTKATADRRHRPTTGSVVSGDTTGVPGTDEAPDVVDRADAAMVVSSDSTHEEASSRANANTSNTTAQTDVFAMTSLNADPEAAPPALSTGARKWPKPRVGVLWLGDAPPQAPVAWNFALKMGERMHTDRAAAKSVLKSTKALHVSFMLNKHTGVGARSPSASVASSVVDSFAVLRDDDSRLSGWFSDDEPDPIDTLLKSSKARPGRATELADAQSSSESKRNPDVEYRADAPARSPIKRPWTTMDDLTRARRARQRNRRVQRKQRSDSRDSLDSGSSYDSFLDEPDAPPGGREAAEPFVKMPLSLQAARKARPGPRRRETGSKPDYFHNYTNLGVCRSLLPASVLPNRKQSLMMELEARRRWKETQRGGTLQSRLAELSAQPSMHSAESFNMPQPTGTEVALWWHAALDVDAETSQRMAGVVAEDDSRGPAQRPQTSLPTIFPTSHSVQPEAFEVQPRVNLLSRSGTRLTSRLAEITGRPSALSTSQSLRDLFHPQSTMVGDTGSGGSLSTFEMSKFFSESR